MASFGSYSAYVKAMGANNPFVMTKQEYNESILTVEQKHKRLEQRLIECQDAWYRSVMAGLYEDAEHAKVNERRAYYALIAFEKENGISNE